MRPKGYLLIFLLLIVTQSVHAQQLTDQYIQVEGKNRIINKIEIGNKKQINIEVAEGIITIHLTAKFKNSVSLYYHAYFKEGDPRNTSDQNSSLSANYGGMLYLAPEQSYIVDILIKKTDSLVCRYVIKRPKLIPKLAFYQSDLEKPLQNHFFTDESGQLQLPALEKIDVKIIRDPDFKNLEIEYNLLNLKTKKKLQKISKKQLETLTLEPNTTYELRVNYVVEQESVVVTYIKVKPYWYQSPLKYFIISIVILVLGFILSTIIYKNRIKSSKKQQVKMEQAAIRLQSLLNPHFTFNALSSIQGLMNTDRIDEANQYLEEFSSLLRKTLAKSKDVYTTLDQELEMMRMYIRLEAFRFNFTWDIEIDPQLNPSVIEIPTLLLQPLIENAIKHGLSGLGEKAQLRIICKQAQKNDTFIIVIKDNGTWIDKNSGYGLSLTAERIATINKMTKAQSIELHFNKQIGTEAILTFHNWI